jgi:hypothetical protein
MSFILLFPCNLQISTKVSLRILLVKNRFEILFQEHLVLSMKKGLGKWISTHKYYESLNDKLWETIQNMPIKENNIILQYDKHLKHIIKNGKIVAISTIQNLYWPAQNPSVP